MEQERQAERAGAAEAKAGAAPPAAIDADDAKGKPSDTSMLERPETFEVYEKAIGDLGDAGGLPSAGGPAV